MHSQYYPQLRIDLGKLRENAAYAVDKCAQCGIQVSGVIKGMHAFLPGVRQLQAAGVSALATSRLDQAAAVKKAGIDLPVMLIRVPMISDAEDVVKYCDYSLNSEKSVLEALNEEAGRQNKIHKVLLMADVGDLREGWWDKSELARTALYVEHELSNLHLAGTGINVGCYGSVVATPQKLQEFVDITEKVEKQLGRKLEILSGGATSSFIRVLEGTIPDRINNLRIGEGILNARDLPELFHVDVGPMHKDCFLLRTEVLEVRDKPSYPVGELGVDAFGRVQHYEDRGIRKRALVAVGKADFGGDPQDLIPLEEGIEVLGASSDHAILDVQDLKRDLHAGDFIDFRLDYASLVYLTHSKDVRQVCVDDPDGLQDDDRRPAACDEKGRENMLKQKYPQLRINLHTMKENVEYAVSQCKKQGVQVTGVIKGMNALIPCVKTMAEAGVSSLATSRLDQAAAVKEAGIDLPVVLIRIPMISDLEDVVKYCDYSLNSDIDVLKALNEEAGRQNKIHKVILMADVGDLREGWWDKEEMARAAVCVENDMPNLHLAGAGINIGCYGSVMATVPKLQEFVDVAEKIETAIGRKLEILSGGATSSFARIQDGTIPERINNLRIGEGLLIPRSHEDGDAVDFGPMKDDAFTLRLEVLEVKDKPSYPVGELGVDAFGRVQHYVDRGIRTRALAACGNVDYGSWEDIFPMQKGIEVIGASSDHTILDVQDAEPLKPGDLLDFKLDYASLVFLSHSTDVQIEFIDE